VYVVYRATNVQTFVPSPGATVGGSFGIQGNLNFFGTGNRITADFSNATAANRVSFQSSTTNGNTIVPFIPNGAATQTNLALYNGSDVTTNFSLFTIRHNTTASSFASAIGGTGAYVPMIFETGGSERARIATNGDFSFNSGYGSAAVAYGCRAWVNFNGTGTVAIRASGNVSSITDGGVGFYLVNFTNAMPDVNYAVATAVGNDTVNNTANTVGARTVSSVRAVISNSSGSLIDDSYVAVSVFR
jgi:hypothetical protein